MLLVTGGEEAHRFGAQALPGFPYSGMALALLLVTLGHPATAGFALQPYWLPYYGLLLLLDVSTRTKGPVDPRAARASVGKAQGPSTRHP